MAALLEILLVEDNDALREEMVSFLQRPGWNVRGVDCGEAMDAALRLSPADIALLDLNLPFEDGLSIAARMRQQHPQLGTAHGVFGQQCGQRLDGGLPGRLGSVAVELAAAQPLVLIAMPATQAYTLGAEHGTVSMSTTITR